MRRRFLRASGAELAIILVAVGLSAALVSESPGGGGATRVVLEVDSHDPLHSEHAEVFGTYAHPLGHYEIARARLSVPADWTPRISLIDGAEVYEGAVTIPVRAS